MVRHADERQMSHDAKKINDHILTNMASQEQKLLHYEKQEKDIIAVITNSLRGNP